MLLRPIDLLHVDTNAIDQRRAKSGLRIDADGIDHDTLNAPLMKQTVQRRTQAQAAKPPALLPIYVRREMECVTMKSISVSTMCRSKRVYHV